MQQSEVNSSSSQLNHDNLKRRSVDPSIVWRHLCASMLINYKPLQTKLLYCIGHLYSTTCNGSYFLQVKPELFVQIFESLFKKEFNYENLLLNVTKNSLLITKDEQLNEISPSLSSMSISHSTVFDSLSKWSSYKRKKRQQTFEYLCLNYIQFRRFSTYYLIQIEKYQQIRSSSKLMKQLYEALKYHACKNYQESIGWYENTFYTLDYNKNQLESNERESLKEKFDNVRQRFRQLLEQQYNTIDQLKLNDISTSSKNISFQARNQNEYDKVKVRSDSLLQNFTDE
ncbi:unnamed protein product [Didymodactylos carnosus]|uniref:Uncharacterized protein n=1 Tax=Didymodactylos carnosus TaxID=1234261 RepID=A0A815QJ50_9BILA|nr:unnamed protein product [Didymodactylos carnosus]CAF4333548.1 unnamed protein product [Didymodactylos carnosus]